MNNLSIPIDTSERECQYFSVCGEYVERKSGKKPPFTCSICKAKRQAEYYKKNREKINAKRRVKVVPSGNL